MYGADMSYKSALRQAEAQETAAFYNMFGEATSGAAQGFGTYMASDIAVKENISLVGKSDSGVNIYEFDYKDKSYSNRRYCGVMAQEVPWAAKRARNGYLMVDYSKVDVNFTYADNIKKDR